MEYIRTLSKPEDGKLLAIGHSMGGILLYAMLSRYGKVSCQTCYIYYLTFILSKPNILRADIVV